MTDPYELPDLLVEPVVRAALQEDLGRAGDITTAATVPAGARFEGAVAARAAGTLAGVQCARLAFRLLDPGIEITEALRDGARLEPATVAMRLTGPARAVLAAERTALNFLCHLSGIATATVALVAAVGEHPARITCTRKTTPNLRALEKMAVRAGGGVSHRFGLDDGVLIKDNHVAMAGGVGPAVERAKAAVGHMVKVEVEVDRLDQLDAALAAGADAILLDNMSVADMAEAVRRTAGRAVLEASGRVTAESVTEIAATGVDIISAGWITHSAPSLDLGLDAA